MSKVRVAINGFGRIGRMVFRAGFNNPDIEFVAVNDLTDTKTLAHLLKYDSTQGIMNAEIGHSPDTLIVNGRQIKVCKERDPTNLPWKNLNVDVVIESTGFFTKRADAAKHLTAGAKKVFISGPSKDADFMIVKGVNEHLYDRNKHHVISNASCTTNCLAPMVKVLNDNYKVKKGFMTTVHSYTNDQKVLDAPHEDLRRARSAAVSIVPTTTGAATAVAMVIPELKGKLDGISIRVPTPVGSITDFVCEVEKEVTKEEINALFKSVSEYHLKGVLQYTDEPLVSADIVRNPHSCIFDSELTNVLDKHMVKVIGWYDNEWGYSNRMIDLLKMLL